MKIAFLMTDGLEQFVLTAETDAERKMLTVLTDSRGRDVSIHSGKFHETKYGFAAMTGYYSVDRNDNSAIICLREPAPVISKTASEIIADEIPETMS